MSEDITIYIDDFGNSYVIEENYVFLIGGKYYYNPVPEGFDLSWIMSSSEIPIPEPIPYTGPPFENWEDFPWGDNPGTEDNPPETQNDRDVKDLLHSWVTNRTQWDIEQVLRGSTLISVIDRATISYRVAKRWEDAINKINAWLNIRGIFPDQTHHTITNMQRMTCTYPDIPFPYSTEWAAPDDEDDDWIPYESALSYGVNTIYELFVCFKQLMQIASPDISDLTLPRTSEYLYYYEVNAIEEAMYRTTQKLIDTYDTRKTHYSGQLISGGYLYV